MTTKVDRVLVGLGNPGEQYDFTRHNLGFMVMDRLAALSGAAFTRADHLHAEVSQNSSALVVKPLTGMNDSGRCVRAIMDAYGLDLSSLMVVYDDVSLPTGKMRFKFAGSAGGHHGIESVIREMTGQAGFHKAKLGVGPDPGGARRFEYVLAKLQAAEREHYTRIAEVAADACIFWLTNDSQKCANRYNSMTIA